MTFTVALPMLAADIIDVTPDPRTTAVASIAIALNRPVTGVDISDLQLTRNGIDVPLTGAVIASTNGVLWTLSGLTAATSSIGIYTLTLNAGSSGIVDTAGRALAVKRRFVRENFRARFRVVCAVRPSSDLRKSPMPTLARRMSPR